MRRLLFVLWLVLPAAASLAQSVAPPTVETLAATATTPTSATLNGRIASDGGAAILETRFEWRRQGDAAWIGMPGTAVGAEGSFSANLSGLSGNTTYEFRAGARNSAGWGHGTVLTFVTPDDPVTVRIESFIVDTITAEGGARQERLVPATTARPGQVVEYRIFVTNGGATTLPAGTVVITGPIPQGTVYLDLSATPTSERLLTEFTADGNTFIEAPVLVTAADGSRRVVDPSEYTAVRWTLLFALEPGQEETLFYRVMVQ